MLPDDSSPPWLSTVPLVGVAVNAALASIKILAGFFGNSYALIADGIERTADIVTSRRCRPTPGTTGPTP